MAPMPPNAGDNLITGDLTERFALLSLDNFRDVSVVPTVSDFVGPEDGSGESVKGGIRSQAPTNVVEGPYASTDQYLGTHFHLARENLVRSLRDVAAAAASKGKPGHGVRHYEDVIIKTVWFEKGRIAIQASFNAQKLGKVDWSTTKRLTYGTLLCLSRDNFKTSFRFATVASNVPEMVSRGTLLLFVEDDHKSAGSKKNSLGMLDSWQGTWIAVESPVYFFDTRHVLKNLQKMDFDKLPLSKCILKFEGGNSHPEYLRIELESAEFKLVIPAKTNNAALAVVRADLDGNLQWPLPGVLGFDGAQLAAFKAGLTHQVAVIQGPPGSGKTHIGVEIMRTLLHNRHWGKGTPILVICKTNLALDQLLDRSLAFTTKVVRVGRRSKSETLQNYMYWNWISDPRKKKLLNKESLAINSEVRGLYRRRGRLEENIEVDLLRRAVVTSGAGIMTLDKLMKETGRPGFPKASFSTMEWLGLKKGGPLGAKFVDDVLDREKQKLDDAVSQEAKNKPSRIQKWFQDANQVQKSAGGKKVDGKAIESLVDHWYKIEEPDNGSFNPYFVRKETSQYQEQILAITFEASITNCDIQIRKSKAKIKLLDEEDESLPKNGQKKTNDKLLANHGRRQQERNKIAKEDKTSEIIRSAMALLRMPLFPEDFAAKIPCPLKKIPTSWDEVRKLKAVDCWLLYRYLLSDWLKKVTARLNGQLSAYKEAGLQLEAGRCKEHLTLYHQMDIVGMTMTRAALDIDVLNKLKPKIVVCEEAAQVFESGIVAALPTSCEHLILIGDHKQLRPQTQVTELALEHKMNISMFERLVLNNVPHVTMETQHRMRPEIADLIRPTYGTLQDGGQVDNYPDVPGVGSNVFFVTHENPEDKEVDSRSYGNVWEVDFLLSFCEYLIKQGCKDFKINILTLYARQIDRFVERKPAYPSTKKVAVRTVDGYQGEENDIILLSLVRSNDLNQAGFVKAANRANVALSRAKLGLFMVGNMTVLRENCEYWSGVEEKLKETGRIGPKLPLTVCGDHGRVFAEKPEDFKRVADTCCIRCRKVPCSAVNCCGLRNVVIG